MFKCYDLFFLIYLIGSINPYLYDTSHATMGQYGRPPFGVLNPQGYQNSIWPSVMPKRSRPEIKLYYETMCPSCRIFDSSVFSQLVAILGPYLDIFTYPYGKATTLYRADGSLDFICQHGPYECYGNKLHACALDLINQRDQALQFNGCMMRPGMPGNGSNDASADQCGLMLGINADPIKQCAKGPKGSLLLKSYGDETGLVNLQYVPHLEINGQLWKGQQENLLKDVCAAFVNPPAACRGII